MRWFCSIASISRISTWRTWKWFPTSSSARPHELLLRLNWVAVLYGKIKADLAVTGGVHSGLDVLKSMMAGASVAMMTSASAARTASATWPRCEPNS